MLNYTNTSFKTQTDLLDNGLLLENNESSSVEKTLKQPNLCHFIADVVKAKQYIYHLLRKTSAYQVDQWYFSFAAWQYLTNSYALLLSATCAQGQYLTACHGKAIVNFCL